MATPQTHGTGCIRQPVDTRDYQLTGAIPTLTTASYPPSHSLVEFVHRVEDQGNTSRCQSFAAIKGMEIQRAKEGLPYIDPSFDWTYWFARQIDSVVAGTHGTVAGDSGATNRSAMKSLATSGLCQVTHHRKDGTYDGWPNSKATMDIDPEQWWQQNHFQEIKRVGGLYECDQDPQLGAHHHKSVTYRAVDTTVASVRGSIANGFAVLLGIPARESLYGVQQDGIMSIPTDAEHLYGYHSIVALGYDDTMVSNGTKGYFHIINSWSAAWGQSGYGWLPYAWFDATPGNTPFDLWTIHAAR